MKLLRLIVSLCLAVASLSLVSLSPAHATVQTSASKTIVLGNGSATQFSFSFIGVATAYVAVIYTDAFGNQTTLSQGSGSSQYQISLNSAPQGGLWGIGGTVTYNPGGTPIATGTTLTIYRTLPLTQAISLQNQISLAQLGNGAETGLDLGVMEAQQIYETIDRAIVAPITDPPTINLTLPTAAQRANTGLAFDSQGNVIAGTTPATGLISSAMQPVVDAASLALGRTAFGLGGAAVLSPNCQLLSNASAAGNLDVGSVLTQVATNQAVAASNCGSTYVATGPITFTLPRANTLWNGFGFWLHVVAGGQVTLAINASDSIEGLASGTSGLLPVGSWAWIMTDAASSGTWRVQLSYALGSFPMAVGPTPLYVNSSLGSDSNACTAAGANACKTIQHAVNLAINSVSYGGTGPTINVADGTYAEQVVCSHPLTGASVLTITGDTVTPTNVIWAPPSSDVALNVTNGCNVTVSGVYFNGASACAYLDVFNATISFQTVNFGALNNAAGCGEHILADHGAIVNILGSYTISGNMTYHILAVGPSFIQHVEASFSMPNALTFTDFYSISGPASVNYDQTVTCSGTGCGSGSTGAQFTIIGNGNISSNSSTIPGASAGLLTGGGCKDLVCGAATQIILPGLFSALPSCAASTSGSIGAVVNSSTVTWGAASNGSGANFNLVVCDGSSWKVVGT